MSKIYTKENIIDLYSTAPVFKIELSNFQLPHLRSKDIKSCPYEPDSKRIRQSEDEEMDLPEIQVYKDLKFIIYY